MSFMVQYNSCLVGCELGTANGSIDFYKRQFLGRTANWANPSIDEAVVWMKRLVSDRRLRIAKGQRAAESIRRYQAKARQVRFTETIISEWQQRCSVSQSSRLKQRAAILT